MTKNIIITILILTNIAFVYFVFTQNGNIVNLQKTIESQKINSKVVLFTQTLIDKVLKSTKPVDFENRLALENMVRDINDKDILDKWNTFVKSTDNNQAQIEIKNLLDILVKRISVAN